VKIAATCDIHYDLLVSAQQRREFDQFIGALAAERPDVLILAGDVVGLGWNKLGECLERFAGVSPVRLMVFGNHDHWCADRRSLPHLQELAEVVVASGFRLLDHGPEVIAGVGFAGNSLWYDYSLAAVPAAPGDSYVTKVFAGRLVWNDAQFIGLEVSDGEYSRRLLARLDQDLLAIETRSSQIVAVTHHVGFRELLQPHETEPGREFCVAFMGTARLGDLLLSRPKVRVHVCGHSHRPARLRKNGLDVINPGSDYRRKRYSLFEVV
jgi:predicted phosphodiesterase